MERIIIDGDSLGITDVVDVAKNNYKVKLSDKAIKKVKESRELVDKLVSDEKTVYGITTGFGKFSDVFISKDETKKLQKNLIFSHSCGVGNPLKQEIVRAIMLLRVNALAKGNSGIRLCVLKTIINMINKGVHPIIPEKGSLGASGDLAPLAHMVLVLIGEGEAIYKGKRLKGKIAMNKAGIQIVELTSKEGLALINGTQVMTAIGAITVHDAFNLMKIADIISGLSFEASNGIIDAFDEKIHNLRRYDGQRNTANNLLKVLSGSRMTSKQGEIRVQDAYTLRCIPQIHGASKDAINYVYDKVSIEINSATDNPLIFPEHNEIISGGNFHGQPLALAFDFLSIAISETANVSERRIERLVNPALSGLPAFLIENGGLNSGFMIIQYSAASLVSENKVLSHPASTDSIPSSANQEDHVSMGTIAARKSNEILDNTITVLAMELLCACQAIDLRGNKGLGIGTERIYNLVRNNVSLIEKDEIMNDKINICKEIIKSDKFVSLVEEVVGKLKV